MISLKKTKIKYFNLVSNSHLPYLPLTGLNKESSQKIQVFLKPLRMYSEGMERIKRRYFFYGFYCD